MLNTVNEDLSSLVIYTVDDSVIPGSDSIAIFDRQFLAAVRTRIVLEVGDFFKQCLEGLACETIHIFLRPGEQEDLIHFDS